MVRTSSITQEHVSSATHNIQALGVTTPIRNIRESVGGGNLNTINKCFQIWHSEGIQKKPTIGEKLASEFRHIIKVTMLIRYKLLELT
jgi:hypothetical protein